MDNGQLSKHPAIKKPGEHRVAKTVTPPVAGVVAPEAGFGMFKPEVLVGRAEGLPNVVDLFAEGKGFDDGENRLNLESIVPPDESSRYDERLREALARAEEWKARCDDFSETIETICQTLTNELRGPLRGMAGLSQLLLKENGLSMNDTAKNYTERVVASATKMDHLIKDLVRYGRMSGQDFACENVSLETCVCEVVGAMASTLAARNAAVQMERPFPQVWANARTLRDVVAQLLENMLVFAKTETAPCFHIRAESGDSTVRLYIAQNGDESTSQPTEQIPDHFQTTNGRPQNIGIGMALVEKGLAKMGGRVNADFDPEGGSCFWIELNPAR